MLALFLFHSVHSLNLIFLDNSHSMTVKDGRFDTLWNLYEKIIKPNISDSEDLLFLLNHQLQRIPRPSEFTKLDYVRSLEGATRLWSGIKEVTTNEFTKLDYARSLRGFTRLWSEIKEVITKCLMRDKRDEIRAYVFTDGVDNRSEGEYLGAEGVKPLIKFFEQHGMKVKIYLTTISLESEEWEMYEKEVRPMLEKAGGKLLQVKAGEEKKIEALVADMMIESGFKVEIDERLREVDAITEQIKKLEKKREEKLKEVERLSKL